MLKPPLPHTRLYYSPTQHEVLSGYDYLAPKFPATGSGAKTTSFLHNLLSLSYCLTGAQNALRSPPNSTLSEGLSL